MKRQFFSLLSLLIIFILALSNASIPVYAEEDYMALAEERKKMTVESNLIENWPVGPEIGSESAILIEANTGVILYEKNIHAKLYPASITKLLTALVAYDNSKMDDMVTFSYDAVGSIDWRYDANMGITGGSSITMEQTLYGMLVGSANEAAYAIAEHVSGNLPDFADKMNEKAISLGCVDSHFVTPNGIHDDNHYTSAYDMSLIAKAFFSNDQLAKISATPKYHVPQSSTQPKDDMIVYAKSKLFPGKEYACEGLVGTKTGYTDYARQTLVSCAERNGMRLICVVMKEEAPYQYTDTLELFNYGFNNFTMVTVADKDKKYKTSSLTFLTTESDLFGNSKPILEISPSDYIILPIGTDIDRTSSYITYDNLNEGELARINYSYSDTYIGYASLVPSGDMQQTFSFGAPVKKMTVNNENDNFIFINIFHVIGYIVATAVGLIVLFYIISAIRNSHKMKQANTNNTKKEKKESRRKKTKHFK